MSWWQLAKYTILFGGLIVGSFVVIVGGSFLVIKVFWSQEQKTSEISSIRDLYPDYFATTICPAVHPPPVNPDAGTSQSFEEDEVLDSSITSVVEERSETEEVEEPYTLTISEREKRMRVWFDDHPNSLPACAPEGDIYDSFEKALEAFLEFLGLSMDDYVETEVQGMNNQRHRQYGYRDLIFEYINDETEEITRITILDHSFGDTYPGEPLNVDSPPHINCPASGLHFYYRNG